MSDQHDDQNVRAAFDRLRTDASKVDTMAALRKTNDHGRRVSWLALSAAGAAMTAILVIVGVAVWGGDDETEDVSAGDPTAQPSDVTAEMLDGTSWVLLTGSGPDGDIPIVASQPVTLEFTGNQLGGNTGCNTYGAEFLLTDALELGVLEATEEGCDGDVGTAERNFLAALDDANELSLTGGELAINGPSTELIFRSSGGAGPDATALDGTSWVLASGVGDEGQIPIVDGWPVTLTFDGDNIGGTAACNGYGGAYLLDGDALLIEAINQTEMACDGAGAGDVMASEALFLRAMITVDRLVVDGSQLTLTGPSTELIFDLEAPLPVADLVGQLWLLDTIIQGDAASSVLGESATLLLSADGTVEGGTGCRTFSGEYVITGAIVQFTTFAADGGCPADLADQDNAVITVLGDGFTADIEGDRLTLTSQGDEGLGYVAIGEILPAPEPGTDVPESSTFDDIACQAAAPDPAATGAEPADHVTRIESFEQADCRRTVFHLGVDVFANPTPIEEFDASLFQVADGALPGIRIDVPETFGIDFEVELLDTSVGVAAVAQNPDGRFYLYVDHGGGDSTVSYWPNPARIVVDTRIESATAATPVVGEVILPRPVGATLDGMPVIFAGLARPFEATGSVSLRIAPQPGTAPGSGELVEATWSGFDVLGNAHVGSSYGYSTASIETWGEFSISVDSLPPGDYEILFESFAPEESGSAGTYVAFSVVTAPVELVEDGLAVVTTNGGLETFTFGTPQGDVLAELERVLGTGTEQQVSPECPNQPDAAFTFDEVGLSLDFRSGEMISWSLTADSPLTTRGRIGLGSTLAQLTQAHPTLAVEVFESSLGPEFLAGQLGGLLSGTDPSAEITNFWGGEICAFR